MLPAAAATVTRVTSNGYATISLNVLTKDMGLFGYADGTNRDRSANSITQL